MTLRLILAISAIAGMALTGLAAYLFQDNLTRFFLNPRTPYQTYTPPPPPAYGARGAWALWPDDPLAGEADIFYVHSTTYASNRHWNAPLTDADADATLRRIAAPNEAGPFMRVGAVYGPRYRQATLFTAFTHKFDGLAARQLAYQDVEAAFLHFLKSRPADRPVILVGYGQGGLHVLGLLSNHVAGRERVLDRLAAAYVIDEPIPLSLFDGPLAAIPPCRFPRSSRCIVSYLAVGPGFEEESRRFRQRSLTWTRDGRLASQRRSPLLCVNPISWTASPARADADAHVGAASATGLRMRETPPAIAKAIGAQCVNGVLRVDQPRQTFLRKKHWFGEHWRPQNFNLFYHDLARDAARRVRNLRARQAAADAGAGAVDLGRRRDDNDRSDKAGAAEARRPLQTPGGGPR